MNRLYQWLYERATFFRGETYGSGNSRIVRRETTIQQEQRTLIVGSGTSQDSGFCPFCGQRLPAMPSVQEDTRPGEPASGQGKKAPRKIR